MSDPIYEDCIRMAEGHEEGCKFRRAVVCAVAIECKHGYDVCPTCDPCTCKSPKE